MPSKNDDLHIFENRRCFKRASQLETRGNLNEQKRKKRCSGKCVSRDTSGNAIGVVMA
jgi:hypothetical protein